MTFVKSISFTAVLTLTAFVSVLHSACKKNEGDKNVLPADGCLNVSCLNGGKCDEGECSCPLEYEGDQCERKVLDRYIGIWKGDISCAPQTGSGMRTLQIKPASVPGIQTVWILDSVEAVLITPDSLNIPKQQFGYYPYDSLTGYIKLEQGKLLYYQQDIRWSNANSNKPEMSSCTGYMTRQ